MPGSSSRSRSHLATRSIHILPWILGLTILAGLLIHASPDAVLRGLQSAQLLRFLTLVAGASLLWFLLDSAALAFLFGRFHRPEVGAPLSWSQARRSRALTYLLTPIHWNVGRAGLVLHLSRATHTPLLDTTSTMLFQQTVDAGLLTGLAWLGLAWLPPSPEVVFLRRACGLLFVGLLALCVGLASARSGPNWLSRIPGGRLIRTHGRARARDFATLGLLRVAYYLVFVGVYVWGLRAFGLDLPLALVLAAVPIVQAIGSIPVTPAGLGTQQAAMLLLFRGYGQESAIVAFGLALPFVQLLARCGIGVVYLAGGRGARRPVAGRQGPLCAEAEVAARP